MEHCLQDSTKIWRLFSHGHLMSCAHAILFCFAIILNVLALHRLRLCTPSTSHSTSDQEHCSVFDNSCETSSLSILQIQELILSIDPLARLSTFESVTFEAELFSNSVYKGFPREELDDAWNQLVDRMYSLRSATISRSSCDVANLTGNHRPYDISE
jgi:hypothetical protein